MRRLRAAQAFLVVSSLAVVVIACGEDETEQTPALGTCDLRSVQSTCIEIHDASSSDLDNQEEGCVDGGGDWSNDACPTEALVGCCEYEFGNSFRECFYVGSSTDGEAYCQMSIFEGTGVWTPAP